MSKTIKLSKSDWMRIGRESGYIKGAQIVGNHTIFELLRADLPNLMERLDDLDTLDVNNEKLRSAAGDLLEGINMFMLHANRGRKG